MSHRGQNANNNTVQIWNGTRWVSYPSLNFQSAVLSTAKSLWVESDDSVGLTLGGSNRRSLSPVYDGTGTPIIATKRIYAHRLGGTDEPQTIELPKIVSGVAPVLLAQPRSMLLADILLAVHNNNGSLVVGTRYVARWVVSGAEPTPYTAEGVEALGAGGATVTNGVVSGGPTDGAPTIIVNNSFAPGDTYRYMLDINMVLMGVTA